MRQASGDQDLLAEQRAFYRARAPDYDQWWLRQGPYDHGPADTVDWERQVAQVTQALNEFAPVGNVLELAGGTGWWTRELARQAASLTVIDSSEEALTINRQRVDRTGVTYQVADISTWQPAQRYDAVFFSFWLSHVPQERFENFWALVASCLEPEGRVFLIDNRRNPARASTDPYVVHEADGVQRRRLSDGSEHRVVKIFYEPDELADRLDNLGWAPRLTGTSRFIYGSAALR
jgi:demethylmenaquinone methyltransferase/2-methoxy-6-polyprenyl-1,4-benzoquinol methylase